MTANTVTSTTEKPYGTAGEVGAAARPAPGA